MLDTYISEGELIQDRKSENPGPGYAINLGTAHDMTKKQRMRQQHKKDPEAHNFLAIINNNCSLSLLAGQVRETESIGRTPRSTTQKLIALQG